MLLIGIIVAVFSRPGLGDLQTAVFRLQPEVSRLKWEVSRLKWSVEELKSASTAQTREIRELRKAIEELLKARGKDK